MAIAPDPRSSVDGPVADVADAPPVVDGRRARRDRNRAAVIDALFVLLHDGVTAPSAEAIATGAGVSVSSLFRYFESLEDLQEQTIATHFDRFGPLFTIPELGEGSRGARIERLVDARLALYASIAPVARLARARALVQPRITQTLDETRLTFSTQVRSHFAVEFAARPESGHDAIIDLVDTLTSFESWDLLRSTKERSDGEIRSSWVQGVTAIIA